MTNSKSVFPDTDGHLYMEIEPGVCKDLGLLKDICIVDAPTNPMQNDYSMKCLKPADILRRGHCTIVKWVDGSTTKVVLEDGEQDTGIFGAFCIAFAKKMYGSTEKLIDAIDRADEKARDVRRKALHQELLEARKKADEKKRKAKFELDVAREMYQGKVRDEAMRRLWDKEKGKEWFE